MLITVNILLHGTRLTDLLSLFSVTLLIWVRKNIKSGFKVGEYIILYMDVSFPDFE